MNISSKIYQKVLPNIFNRSHKIKTIIKLTIFFVVCIISYVSAFALLLGKTALSQNNINLIVYSAPILIGIELVLYTILHSRDIIRHFNINDLKMLFIANFASSSSFYFIWNLIAYFNKYDKISIPIVIINFVILSLSCCIIRCFIYECHKKINVHCLKRKRVLILGAGEIGFRTAQKITSLAPPYGGHLLGFLDDSEAKRNIKISGTPILGTLDDTANIVKSHKIDIVIFAIKDIPKSKVREIIASCKDLKLSFKIITTIEDDNTKGILQNNDVKIEDLLGRQKVILDQSPVEKNIHNRNILITGAGGSIGSELVRQIATFSPKHLFILDMAESALYDIEQEIKQKYPELNFSLIIADIKNKELLKNIFTQHSIDIIYHAAAYKHVPLMENHPDLAILNNVMGTRNLAELANEFQVKTFVLISTDKSVRPTNIMGATKRLSELIIQSEFEKPYTTFVAVRFGNVLGSNGSVVPLFKKLIKSGGPVTITDKNIERYFMLIPEAVELVLQCGAMAKDKDIFILDMGKPVKIYDLLLNLIKLSGLVPNKDIEIKEIGLRPGEKMYEELVTYGEELLPSQINGINVLRKNRSYFSKKELWQRIDKLISLSKIFEREQVKKYLWSMIHQTYDNEPANKETINNNESRTAA